MCTGSKKRGVSTIIRPYINILYTSGWGMLFAIVTFANTTIFRDAITQDLLEKILPEST